MSLKIAKFINKHSKVYIQGYNYVLKQQWLFLKYHDDLLASKNPIKYFKKSTANHVHCRSMRCFINIAENWHIVKPGTAEHRKTEYRNTKYGTVKPEYGIPNPVQTVSSASLTRINQDQLTALSSPLDLGKIKNQLRMFQSHFGRILKNRKAQV